MPKKKKTTRRATVTFANLIPRLERKVERVLHEPGATTIDDIVAEVLDQWAEAKVFDESARAAIAGFLTSWADTHVEDKLSEVEDAIDEMESGLEEARERLAHLQDLQSCTEQAREVASVVTLPERAGYERVKSKDYQGRLLTLVDEDWHHPVYVGSKVQDRHGDEYVVVGGQAPHKQSSEGRIYVRPIEDDDPDSPRSLAYYPSAFGVLWSSKVRRVKEAG